LPADRRAAKQNRARKQRHNYERTQCLE
jgi:hypothetical protein